MLRFWSDTSVQLHVCSNKAVISDNGHDINEVKCSIKGGSGEELDCNFTSGRQAKAA